MVCSVDHANSSALVGIQDNRKRIGITLHYQTYHAVNNRKWQIHYFAPIPVNHQVVVDVLWPYSAFKVAVVTIISKRTSDTCKFKWFRLLFEKIGRVVESRVPVKLKARGPLKQGHQWRNCWWRLDFIIMGFWLWYKNMTFGYSENWTETVQLRQKVFRRQITESPSEWRTGVVRLGDPIHIIRDITEKTAQQAKVLGSHRSMHSRFTKRVMGKNSPYVEDTDLWKESFGRFTITKVGVVTAQTDIQMHERQDTGDVRLIRGGAKKRTSGV
ncbi:uncharacterized protein F5147DRAFT_653755 [Suillus discolor]|uniref:Uncharacterized protein n=1 Tax=Suillus discolor TaxID=1912936 RepID=A0A9P7F5I7_9AGAM|nr:uncharacterized protein F5147DRAFT_653755 [Suillus discolor]KAG2106798.1 hypothetical protein F5147DRAFT_653755 [Suillus discolor]